MFRRYRQCSCMNNNNNELENDMMETSCSNLNSSFTKN